MLCQSCNEIHSSFLAIFQPDPRATKQQKNEQIYIKINFHKAISQYSVAKHFHVHHNPAAALQ